MTNNPNEDKKIIAKKNFTPDGNKIESIEAHYYSAPLPHPEMMEHYERILPGSADRIIKKFEAQSEHRHYCEKIFVKTERIKSLGGLIAGFIIAMSTIVGGIILTIKGKTITGAGSIFSGLALLVGSFIVEKFNLGKKKNRKNDSEE